MIKSLLVEIIIGKFDFTLTKAYTLFECKLKVLLTCLLHKFKMWMFGPAATASKFVPTS